MYKMKILVFLLFIMNAQAMEQENDKAVSIEKDFFYFCINEIVPKHLLLQDDHFENINQQCTNTTLDFIDNAIASWRAVLALSVLNNAYNRALNIETIKKQRDAMLPMIRKMFYSSYHEENTKEIFPLSYFNDLYKEIELQPNYNQNELKNNIFFFIGLTTRNLQNPNISYDLCDEICRYNSKKFFYCLLQLYSQLDQKNIIKLKAVMDSILRGIFANGDKSVGFGIIYHRPIDFPESLSDSCLNYFLQKNIKLEYKNEFYETVGIYENNRGNTKYYTQDDYLITVKMIKGNIPAEGAVKPDFCCTIL